jgi:CubicO group peptidase (beta-lactamase class C family)
MKSIYIFIALILATLTMSSKSYAQEGFPVLKGPYMGQKPPGMVAEPFAPGIISKKGWELEGVFAPDMKEFYFTLDRPTDAKKFRPTVIGFRQQNNVWKKYTEFLRTGEVTFSPDGKRMHMAEGYKDRIGDGWTERKSLGPMFDRKDWGIMRLSASAKGTYVFDDYKSKDIIRISTLKNGKRQVPKKMGAVVNTGKWTAHPFIAPDESYLIWDSEREGGYGDSDLYISFRQKDGSWGPAINMGDKVNSAKADFYASVTPDGKYILFNRTMDDKRNIDIYWVDAQIIETLRAKENNSLAPEATAAEAELSFRDIPYLEKAFIDATPADRKDGIPVGKLGINGGNKDMIVKLALEIADSMDGKFDSLLIAHKNKLLFESYYLRGRIDLPHFQASATKAYTSLALGRAIQLGYLSMADLDKPVVSFLKNLDSTKLVEGAEKITLHQAMTMRSGIRISQEQREKLEKNPSQLKGQGQVQAYLELSAPITSESQSFKYQMDPELVMQVIDAAVPGTAKDFIKKELLDKLGITNYRWRTDVSGLPRSGNGSSMTSRDMLKWGTLAMNKGLWQGEQLVPEAFIAKATSRILLTGDDDVYGGGKDVSNQGYGYYWWDADLKYGNKSYFSSSAQGGGGQYIILVEELDLLLVVTAHDNDNVTLQIVAERILPAFM